MFGYACDESKNFMPAPIDFSHKILKNCLIIDILTILFLDQILKAK